MKSYDVIIVGGGPQVLLLPSLQKKKESTVF